MDKTWAKRISWCESRHRPAIHSAGGHHGAFQYLLSTAYAAGFKTDPHLTSWHEQAVRSVRWRDYAGASQWACRA